MSNYFYKGINISTLIAAGNNTFSTYPDFPKYLNTNYSSELANDFGYAETNIPLNSITMCSYIDYTSPASFNFPTNHSHIRAVLIGGGGGGGGAGGCGNTPGGSRTSGGTGGWGQVGDYTAYATDINIPSNTLINITVGTGGSGGPRGGNPSPAGDNAPSGNPGSIGNYSQVSFNIDGTTYNIYAQGGLGGIGGGGGNSGGSVPDSRQGDYTGTLPPVTQSYAVYNQTRTDPTGPSQNTIINIDDIYNPSTWAGISSTNKYTNIGAAGTPGPRGTPGAPGGSGSPGYIRIYFLKQ